MQYIVIMHIYTVNILNGIYLENAHLLKWTTLSLCAVYEGLNEFCKLDKSTDSGSQ